MREHAAPPSTPELTLFLKLGKLFSNFTKTKEKCTITAARPKKTLPHPHGSGPLPDETEGHRNDGGSDEDAGEEVDPPS